MNDALIQKIQKLLALAQSDNEHEAKAAAAMANELLIKYNLDMQSVKNAQFEYDRHETEGVHRHSMETLTILPVIQQAFLVKTVLNRSWNSERKRRISKVTFLGEKTNLAIATHAYEFLMRAYPELFKRYRAETGAPITARYSYYQGLSHGLDVQFAETRAKAEKQKGLVLVDDPGLVKYFKQEFPRTKNRAMGDVDNAKAFGTGVQHGKEIRIHRGVESGGGNLGKRLTGR